MNASAFTVAKAKEMLKTAGATTEDDAAPNLQKFLVKTPTARQMYHCTGGCRMGTDKATSVVDEACRVHDVDNLYVADGSVFPTGSGLNPTLTIQANALRIGAVIAKKFG